jgi:hypothetical protein
MNYGYVSSEKTMSYEYVSSELASSSEYVSSELLSNCEVTLIQGQDRAAVIRYVSESTCVRDSDCVYTLSKNICSSVGDYVSRGWPPPTMTPWHRFGTHWPGARKSYEANPQ